MKGILHRHDRLPQNGDPIPMTLVTRVRIMDRDPDFDEGYFTGEVVLHDVKDSHGCR